MKKVLGRVGQSTLEYVIVLTAIVAAILFAASQFIKPSVNKVYQEAGTTMNASSTLFSNAIGGGLNLSTSSTGATTGSATTGAAATTAVIPS
jgi:type II secretory pathway component PulF